MLSDPFNMARLPPLLRLREGHLREPLHHIAGLPARLGEEYGLEVIFEHSPYAEARWIDGEKTDVEDFMGKYRGQMARDIDQAPVFLAKSSWETGYVMERFPKVAFTKTKERG